MGFNPGKLLQFNIPLLFQPAPNSFKRPGLQQPILYRLPPFPIPSLSQDLSASASLHVLNICYLHMLMPLPMLFPCKHCPLLFSQWGTLIHPSHHRTDNFFCSEKTSPSTSSFFPIPPTTYYQDFYYRTSPSIILFLSSQTVSSTRARLASNSPLNPQWLAQCLPWGRPFINHWSVNTLVENS